MSLFFLHQFKSEIYQEVVPAIPYSILLNVGYILFSEGELWKHEG